MRLFFLSLLLTFLIVSGRTFAQDSDPQPEQLPGFIEASSHTQPGVDNDKPSLDGGMPSNAPPFATSRPPAAALPSTQFQSSPDAPIIDIWYGATQKAGNNGDPLKWVNIQGNVTPASPASLNYTLNGRSPVNLRVGPDTRRLLKPGDFNIEIDYTELNPGANQVVIMAKDSQGETTEATVSLNYQGGSVSWAVPQSKVYDWSTATRIDDLARVVDGKWIIESGSLRPVELGYDRLIGIGDMSWRDYTVTVPITILSVDESGYKSPSNGPGVGVILRWLGHFDSGKDSPVEGWQRLGTLAWYRWERKLVNQTFEYKEGLQAIKYGGLPSDTLAQEKQLEPDTTYIFKLSVQSAANPNQPAIYRFKVWDASLPNEPAAWDMEYEGKAGEPASGGVLLVAHHVDARFGKVTVDLAGIQPPPVLTVNKSGTGTGNVALLPSKANNTYRFGEDVQLTAQPTQDSVFSGWQGSLSGATNPAFLEMFANQSVTAIFSDPNAQTPVSDDFSDCTLNNQWDYVNPLNDSTLTMTGSNVQIAVPAEVAHDLWTNNKNAPRIMQNVENTDFEFDAKFESPMSSRFQVQGVIVEQDSTNFLRFGFQHDGSTYRVTAYTFLNNSPTTRLDQAITVTPPMYLRTERVGNSWTLYYSDNGTSWTNAATFDYSIDANAVGVFVGNAGQNPAMTGQIDYFFNNTSPIDPEDNNRVLMVTTTGTGTGTVQASPAKANYDCGDSVTLTAVPEEGSRFVSWGGDLSGTTNPTTIIMDGSKDVTASFATDGYLVDVAINGNGTVTKSPDKPAYDQGEEVTLTAVAGSGYVFAGWSGDLTGNTNPVIITVTEDKVITANFNPVLYTLQVTVEGQGEVIVNPTGTQFAPGTQVTLTAIPLSDYTFVGWSGDIQGTSNPYQLLMNGNKTVRAIFSNGNPAGNILYLPTIIK
jgi:uncharacterized repeat protein (TIGR02543 family)